MGNTITTAYERHLNRDTVVKFEEPKQEHTEPLEEEEHEEDEVAKPLRPSYPPTGGGREKSPFFVPNSFPQGNGGFLSLHTTYSTNSPTGRNGPEFLQQTRSVYRRLDKGEEVICPVSITTTTRRLDPLRVGAGVVLTKVVQVLEEYPSQTKDGSNVGMLTSSPRRFRTESVEPPTPSQSPALTSHPLVERRKSIPGERSRDIPVPPNSANHGGVPLFNRRTKSQPL